jgi:long-chain acyl-CoA synthetase
MPRTVLSLVVAEESSTAQRGFRLVEGNLCWSRSRLAMEASNFKSRLEQVVGSPGKGRAVSLLISSRLGFMAALLGVWLWDGIPVPLDVRTPLGALQGIESDCEAAIRITDVHWDTRDTAVLSNGHCEVHALDTDREPSAHLGGIPRRLISLVMYTSGSTGAPKGIALPPNAVEFSTKAIAQYLGLTEWDNVLLTLPSHFDYGLYQFLLAGYADCGVTCLGSAVWIDDVIESLGRDAITVLPIVPSLGVRVSRALRERSQPIESVRLVTSTGSDLSLSLIEELRWVFPRAQVMPMYGLTECKRVSYLPPSMVRYKPNSVGRPMKGVATKIVDQNGVELGSNTIGELVVSGQNLALGYLNDSKLTDQVFRRTPEGNVWLHTGDLFKKDDDNFLYHQGRFDDLVKISDQRISLREVESTLKQIEGVVDALAWTESGELVAAVTVAAGHSTSTRALRTSAGQRMRMSAMVPRVIRILDELPTGGTGKPKRPHT